MFENIPKNWKKKKIKDLCDFQNGYAFNSNDYVNEGFPIIRMSNISVNGELNLNTNNTKFFPKENIDKVKQYFLKENDVVIAMTDMSKEMGIIGKTAIIDKSDIYLLNQRVGKFIIKDNKVLNYKYLHAYTNSPLFINYAKQQCSGGVQLNLSTKAIMEHQLLLPPIEEQHEIADVLDAASEIIRLRTACIESAQDLIPALFQEMFGDVKNNTKNWKLCNLNDLVYIDRKNISVNELKTNAYRYIGLEHIEKDTGKILIDLENNFNVDLKSNKYYFTNEHVLYGKLRPYLNKVALPTCDGVCSTDIFPIMPRKNISNKYFIKYLMSSPYFVQITSLKTSGANLPRIGTKALELIKVICPDIEIQNQFAAKAQEIEAYIKTQQAELENAKTMFQSLLHHSFTGELTRHKFGGDANG